MVTTDNEEEQLRSVALQNAQSILLTRRRAEEDLRKQSEWLLVTLSSIGDAVISTDAEGRVMFLNGVAESLTGYPLAEALGRPLPDIFHIINEQSRQPVENPALRALREGTIVGLANHTVLITKDGAEWPIDDSAAPIRNEQGEVAGVVLVFRDITERRRLEHDLRRVAADLSEADRRKNEFLAMLAHELRNPLAPIRNALQIMQLSRDNEEAVQSASEIMERQIDQMVRLVDDLLDVSRISRGKIDLRRELVELALVISQAVETSRPTVERAGHELTVTLPPQPVYLHADPVRLAQVFSNLLNNACKFSEPNGRISLTAEQQGSDVVVSVKDTGVGIPPEMLPKIFEMFAQVDRSLERSQGGLGIGLTLARQLVEMHGGSVSAFSEGRGRGSEFVVRLPIFIEQPKPLPEPIVSELTPTPPRRILIVDDNEDSAMSLAILFKINGDETRMAHDGLEAVETAETFRPDVALLDIGLPKLNGYEVARKIREQPWGQKMALVALTGWGQNDDREKSKVAGFNAHLVKPVKHAAILKLLAELVASVHPEERDS